MSSINSSLDEYFELNNSTLLRSTDASRIQTSGSQQNDWGPNRDALYIVIPITIIYAIIFVTGVVGNICTCVVISRNKSMHTATNYYLFSLAISDLLLLVSGLPPEMYYNWSRYPYIFGEAFCVIQGFTAETSANATVLTITAFTVERYVAICHPFLSHTMSKLSRAVKFVIVVWLFALCFAIPQAMSFGIVYQQSNKDHYVCGVKREILPHAFEISTLVFFVVPMSLITVLYILIALQLRESRIVSKDDNNAMTESLNSPKQCEQNGNLRCKHGQHTAYCCERSDSRRNYRGKTHSKATKHVVKMLIAVVVAFFICWAPFHAQRLLAVHGSSTINADIIVLYTFLTYLSGVLYYLSTCINPLLYNIMSNKFRNAFRETLSRYMPSVFRPRAAVRRYSTMSLPRSVSPTRSQSFSQSGGTSRQPSLRYIDGDMTRRPLVVTFKKPNSQSVPMTCIHTPRCNCRHIDCRRAIYIESKNGIQETSFSIENISEIAPINGRKYKKWTGRRRESPCHLVCAECHRYLEVEKPEEVNRKIIVLVSNKNGRNFIESSSSSGEASYSIGLKETDIDDVQASSDLIPRHQCPNLKNGESPLSTGMGSNTIDSKCIGHSRTMPDIVKHVTVSKKSEACKLVPVPVAEFEKGDQKKWGSVEHVG